ncbi:recombination mediator RecR [Puniceicoccus vermicola]|uniref:Recombination protein RecR n=1 Tax=Puniceicoccus vermicola TaxID=388746 RepID=A0A7X1AXI9_9BACT|nr:recombination mediator RecR [Puniceicoccus vermicola]MBC2601724.1 recombination protein RecR [Puniceicoccus vermicola]
MSEPFDDLVAALKALPGLGKRSAERIAVHLLVGERDRLANFTRSLEVAAREIDRCPDCGNLARTGQRCSVCADASRNEQSLCVVEKIQDLVAIEEAGSWKGLYHVLHGKLSPLQNRGPEDVNLENFSERVEKLGVTEIVFALSNDIEGEATCHYIAETLLPSNREIRTTRIGFGLPSGGDVTYADSVTLRSAMEARRDFRK